MEKILLNVPQEHLREQISQELFGRDYNEIGKIVLEYKRGRKKRK